MPKVELHVLTFTRAANALGEGLSVGVDVEELAFLAQVGGGLLLGDELEGDALGFHVGYLLFDGEHGLEMRFECSFGRSRCGGVLVRLGCVFHRVFLRSVIVQSTHAMSHWPESRGRCL